MERNQDGVTLGVRFVAAGEALHAPKPGTPPSRDALAGVRSLLDPTLTKAMVAAEPKLMAWLRQSKDHVHQFAQDPMAALRKALPDFDPALLARIATIRASAQRVKPDFPSLKIDRFDVSVAHDGKGR
jgi:hypothetical protein